MTDFAFFLLIAVLGVAIAAPFLFVRFVSRGEPLSVMRLFVAPAELPWPRGVQEEEPRPWRWNTRSSESGSLDDPIGSAGNARPDAA